MDKKLITEKINKIIIEQCCLDKDISININTDLISDYGADSLDVVEIVLQIEDEFHLFIDDADFQHCRTVKDFVNLTEKLLIKEN